LKSSSVISISIRDGTAWIKLEILEFLLLIDYLMVLHVGIYCPFTLDDFPRVSSDHEDQSDAVFVNPDIKLRGPKPMFLYPAFKDILVEGRNHVFRSQYQLYDDSESMCFYSTN
jgi:hypothetical protein